MKCVTKAKKIRSWHSCAGPQSDSQQQRLVKARETCRQKSWTPALASPTRPVLPEWTLICHQLILSPKFSWKSRISIAQSLGRVKSYMKVSCDLKCRGWPRSLLLFIKSKGKLKIWISIAVQMSLLAAWDPRSSALFMVDVHRTTAYQEAEDRPIYLQRPIPVTYFCQPGPTS